MSFIEVKDLVFVYNPEDEDRREVLHGINMNIEKGEFVALLGHNGCGKSTLQRFLTACMSPQRAA